MYNIFIFRRALRVNDNLALNWAMQNVDNIIPIFIFTPEQVTNKNSYKSDTAIKFMLESLLDLNSTLKTKGHKLYMFYGDNITVLSSIVNKIDVSNIIFNMDYTPYALKRDKNIETFLKSKNINMVTKEDYLLKEIGTFNKKDGNPYTVFTPFRNNGFKFKIDKVKNIRMKGLIKNSNKVIKDKIETLKTYINDIKSFSNKRLKIDFSTLFDKSDKNTQIGGRKEGLKQLNQLKNQKNYNKNRNTLNIETSRLSAFIKFGNVSIREVYWKVKNTLGNKNDLLSQLFWREFYFYICYYFPKVLKGKNWNDRYDKLKWNWSNAKFEQWCKGETGYPIVDAGMRELNSTGYMHNRARLFTSNFLNRLLGMDWRRGEKYFAQKLRDYDPAVNNGNWQWIASTGVDPKPYFQRLFNPWLQGKKFDPKAEYIKKWLPELKDVPAKELLEWDKYYQNYDLKQLNYHKPIVDYKKARADSIKMYRSV